MVRVPLILVTLNPEQIAKAKEANGKRKRITHALLCGHYGQIFETEKQCLKYYIGWKQNFPTLFSEAKRTDRYEIVNFETTFNLTTKFIEAEIDAEDAQKNTGRRSENKSKSLPENPRLKYKNAGKSGCLVLMLAVLFFVILITMSMP